MAVPAKITKFGNSKGVRLPKVLLQLSQLEGDVELVVKPGEITIRPKSRPHRSVNDRSELADFQTVTNNFDDTEWTW